MQTPFRKFLFILPLILFLCGCQSASVKPEGATLIKIEGNSLSRISKNAEVRIEIYSGSTLLEAQTKKGLNHLPFEYVPNSAISESNARVVVSVWLEGEQLLSGETAILPKQINHVVVSGGEQNTLIHSYWKAVDISGRGIPPNISTTMILRENGRISGFAGCNQYRGDIKTVARFVQIGNLENTHNICANLVMYHENRYFKLLKSAEYFEVKGDQLKLFTPENAKPIIFDRTDKDTVLLSYKRS